MAGGSARTVYHQRRYLTTSLLADFDDIVPFDLGSIDLVLPRDAYLARRAP